MTGYKLLEHTSEIGFEATGKTLDDAFVNAGKAVFEIMTDIDHLTQEQEYTFSVDSENLEALFFDFVDELIYISQAEGLLLGTFDITIHETDDGYTLTATGTGQELRPDMRLQEIKAPTYSDMAVKQQDSAWYLRMFVDV